MAAPGTGKRSSFRVGAVIFDKQRILSAKHNSYKTHPALAKYTSWPNLHAESACVLSLGLDNCRGLSILVARVDMRNNVTMAKPCAVCDSLLRDVGIKKIYFTDWKGEIRCD